MADPEITPDAPPAEPEPSPAAEPDPAAATPPAAQAADPAPKPEDPLADPLVRAALEKRLTEQQQAYEAKLAEQLDAAKSETRAELEAAAKKEAELAAMSAQDRVEAQLVGERQGRADDAAERVKLDKENKEANARLEFLRALGTSDHQLVGDKDFEALAYSRAKSMVGQDGDYSKIIGDLAGANPQLFRQPAAPSSTSTSAGTTAPRGSTPTPAAPPASGGPKDAFRMSEAEWRQRKIGLGFYH